MAIINLKFSKNQYRKMLDDEISEFDFFEEIIQNQSNDFPDRSNICFELQSIHTDDGGAPSVDDFELSEVDYDRITKQGTLSLDYIVHYYFGCDDMNNSQDTAINCNFVIDVQALTMQLKIDEPERLSPAEEL